MPVVNKVLGDFRSTLEAIRQSLPGGDTKSFATVGARIVEGALIGGGIELTGLGVGAIPGMGLGAIAGGIKGVAETYMDNKPKDADADPGRSVLNRRPISAAWPEVKITPPPPVNVSFSLNSTLLGRVLMNIGAVELAGQAPAFDGLSQPSNADHNTTDK